MKKAVSLLLLLLLAAALTLSASAEPHAEWDAEAWEDANYSNFVTDGDTFTADYTIDGGIDTAWQKTGAMDANGTIAKDCFVALSWENPVEITSLRVWWRSSTRAEESKDGYVIQTGEGVNRASITWSDVNAVYAYHTDEQESGRYVCDEISFSSPVQTKHLRVLVKRGIDSERGYNPKINEIEVEGTEIIDPNAPEQTPAPASEEPAKTPSPEKTASVTNEPTKAPFVTPDTPTASSVSPAAAEKTEGALSELIPWIVLAMVSTVVLLASVLVLLIGAKKK